MHVEHGHAFGGQEGFHHRLNVIAQFQRESFCPKHIAPGGEVGVHQIGAGNTVREVALLMRADGAVNAVIGNHNLRSTAEGLGCGQHITIHQRATIAHKANGHA